MSDSVSLRGIRTGTPVPRTDREQPVKPSLHIEQWGPEQVAKYLAEKYPINQKPKKQTNRKVEVEMTVIKMTREEYLAERRAGKSRAQIANDLGLKHQAYLYAQLDKWGVRSKEAELEAIQALDSNPVAEETNETAKPSKIDEIGNAVKEALIKAAPAQFEESVQTAATASEEPIQTGGALPPTAPEPAQESVETSRLISVNLPVSVELLQRCFDILADDAYQTACDRGWHQREPHLPTELALIHSEVSEALEADRKDHGKDRVAEELADIVIRVMDTARSHKLDVGLALIAKMEKNKSREFRHGNLPY